MRAALLPILCGVALSCREVLPVEADVVINGYQLDGTVTTTDGMPLDSVSVVLYYSCMPVSLSPLDTIQVNVTDSTKIVYVAVFDVNNSRVRKLYQRYRHPGPVPRFSWDERDDGGQFVPSGKYWIEYVYGDTLVKAVPYLAEGHVTTMTNSIGEFTIPTERLPVGELFDFYNDDGSYDATYQVFPQIDLVFRRSTSRSLVYEVPLDHNRVSHGVFKLG